MRLILFLICLIPFWKIFSDQPRHTFNFCNTTKLHCLVRDNKNQHLWRLIEQKTGKKLYDLHDSEGEQYTKALIKELKVTASELLQNMHQPYTQTMKGYINESGNKVLFINDWPEIIGDSWNAAALLYYEDGKLKTPVIPISRIFDVKFGRYSVSHMSWLLQQRIDIEVGKVTFLTNELKTIVINLSNQTHAVTADGLKDGKIKLLYGIITRHKDKSYSFQGCDMKNPKQKIMLSNLEGKDLPESKEPERFILNGKELSTSDDFGTGPCS